METTSVSQLDPRTSLAPSSSGPLAVGSQVIYGLHGKCTVVAIETKSLGGQPTVFYRLEAVKHPSARPTRPEPAILIPAATAEKGGLRPSAAAAEVDAALAVLASPEYFFDFNLPWNKTTTLLERTIIQEGYLGMAKVISYLHGVKLQHVVFSPETARFAEKVMRGFIREMSEAQKTLAKDSEALIQKILKNKRPPEA